MKKLFSIAFIAFGLLGILYSAALGTESYPNGSEGIKGSTLPPPGFYYKMYTAYITSHQLMDPDGNETADLKVKWFASVHRFIWIYKDVKLFGADVGADVIIPLWHRDTKLIAGPNTFEDREWQMGDIIVEPLDLAWHGERWDLGAAIGAFLPTGEHDSIADPGDDYYTAMFTLGGTYYFDEAKTWSFSLLSRYEIHSQVRSGSFLVADDTKPGDDFHFEWGIGKTLGKIWDVGIVGYDGWQVSDSDEAGSQVDRDVEYHAIGPEVSVFFPPLKCLFSLRHLREYGVHDRAETNRTFLVITKIF